MDSSVGTSTSNKRKEIVFDGSGIEHFDMNEALNDVVNKIGKVVFDEKIYAGKNEELDDLVNRMSKEGTLAISNRTHSSKKARIDTSSFPQWLPPASEGKKLRMKKFVERCSRVGIYSVKDVLLDQDDSPMQTPLDDDDVLKMYQNFKKFDIVMDHSDHLFSACTSPMKQPPKDWVEKIQQDRRILEENLPDTISVRVYESRMDLLRAVIIGQQGTPYHDGLFVFDVYFSSTYPISPPVLRYHSYGLGISPLIYECGEVRLKPFLTVKGLKEEMWVPGTSNMLQLLVCIQDRFLNKTPLFNAPGYLSMRGTLVGEYLSFLYNENTLIKSLKTMVHTMNKPPKNFEGLVVGHFRRRVVHILLACKAYMEGREVGCLVSHVQEEEEEGSGSITFRNDVSSCIEPLVAAFYNIGANEATSFLSLSEKKSRVPASEPIFKIRVTSQSRSRRTQQRMTNNL